MQVNSYTTVWQAGDPSPADGTWPWANETTYPVAMNAPYDFGASLIAQQGSSVRAVDRFVVPRWRTGAFWVEGTIVTSTSITSAYRLYIERNARWIEGPYAGERVMVDANGNVVDGPGNTTWAPRIDWGPISSGATFLEWLTTPVSPSGYKATLSNINIYVHDGNWQNTSFASYFGIGKSKTAAFHGADPAPTDGSLPKDGSEKNVDPAYGGATAPKASFTVSPESGLQPLSVTLTDTSVGGPTAWSWALGDGRTLTGQGPHSVVYDAGGSFTITLTATNANGSSTASRSISVTSSPEEPAGPPSEDSVTNPKAPTTDPGVVEIRPSRAVARATARLNTPLVDLPDVQGLRSERWVRFTVDPYLVDAGQAVGRPTRVGTARSNIYFSGPRTTKVDRPLPAEVNPNVGLRYMALDYDTVAGTWTSGTTTISAVAGHFPTRRGTVYRLPTRYRLGRQALQFLGHPLARSTTEDVGLRTGTTAPTGGQWMTADLGTQKLLTVVMVVRPRLPEGAPFYGLLESRRHGRRGQAMSFGLRARAGTLELALPRAKVVESLYTDVTAQPMLVGLTLDTDARVARMFSVSSAGRLTRTISLPASTGVIADVFLGRTAGTNPFTAARMHLYEINLAYRALTFSELDDVVATLDLAYGITG